MCSYQERRTSVESENSWCREVGMRHPRSEPGGIQLDIPIRHVYSKLDNNREIFSGARFFQIRHENIIENTLYDTRWGEGRGQYFHIPPPTHTQNDQTLFWFPNVIKKIKKKTCVIILNIIKYMFILSNMYSRLVI